MLHEHNFVLLLDLVFFSFFSLNFKRRSRGQKQRKKEIGKLIWWSFIRYFYRFHERSLCSLLTTFFFTKNVARFKITVLLCERRGKRELHKWHMTMEKRPGHKTGGSPGVIYLHSFSANGRSVQSAFLCRKGTILLLPHLCHVLSLAMWQRGMCCARIKIQIRARGSVQEQHNLPWNNLGTWVFQGSEHRVRLWSLCHILGWKQAEQEIKEQIIMVCYHRKGIWFNEAVGIFQRQTNNCW